MEDKELQKSIKQMFAGLEGMVNFIEGSTKDVYKKHGKDSAEQFAKTLKESKYDESISKLKKEISTLGKELNKIK